MRTLTLLICSWPLVAGCSVVADDSNDEGCVCEAAERCCDATRICVPEGEPCSIPRLTDARRVLPPIDFEGFDTPKFYVDEPCATTGEWQVSYRYSNDLRVAEALVGPGSDATMLIEERLTDGMLASRTTTFLSESSAQTFEFRYAYDEHGRVARVVRRNSDSDAPVDFTAFYPPGNTPYFISEQTGDTQIRVDYILDSHGYPIELASTRQRADERSWPTTWVFRYDALGELHAVENQGIQPGELGPAMYFDRDAEGNVERERFLSDSRFVPDETREYEYDARGRLTRRGNLTLQYCD